MTANGTGGPDVRTPDDAPPPANVQHVGDGTEGGRPFADLMDSGLLWLINTTVFHPRGLALALHVDRTTGDVTGWSLMCAGDGEAFRYAVGCELDDPTKAVDVDGAFRAAEAMIAAARQAS